MNKKNLINNYQEGIPDEEMPELKEEDFKNAKPNRFANSMFRLDDDIARFFKTPQEVNTALRLVIQLSQVVSHK
ncbi:MAG: hypothetical protein HQK79_18230 [Desulfobacterales bacterium]|nr:hypothetical protein [Desulfobacterales bacterium]MBF0397765.1 hypothetical protein [Desulfobacterales bacterium]